MDYSKMSKEELVAEITKKDDLIKSLMCNRTELCKDELTDAFIRKTGYKLIEEKISKIEHEKNSVLCFIDLNNLKFTNDTFGHEAGDNALAILSSTIRKNIRVDDILVRQGGDEFLVFLNNMDKAICKRILTKIREDLNDINKDLDYPISFSAGMVDCDSNCSTLKTIIDEADKQMYIEKVKIHSVGLQ